MKIRVWVSVLAATLTLVVVSSARLFFVGLVERVGALPWSIVLLGTISCLLLLLSLSMLYRTWLVRKSLVCVLARFGTPDPVIARTVNLPQDGVTFLRFASGGKRGFTRQEIFSAAATDSPGRHHEIQPSIYA